MLAIFKIDGIIISADCEVVVDVYKYRISLRSKGQCYPRYIDHIQTSFLDNKEIALVGCDLISTYSGLDFVNYTYSASYVLFGSFNVETGGVKQLLVRFDKVTSLTRERFVPQYDERDFRVNRKTYSNLLYENKQYSIELQSGFNSLEASLEKTIFNRATYIVFSFKNHIKIGRIFEYIRYAECIFGFIICRKLGLNSIRISDGDNVFDIVTPYMKEYVEYDNPNVLIKDTKKIKKVIEKYFSDPILAACIDNYYEYLYNDLDPVFKYASLCNQFEMLSSCKFYCQRIRKYTDRMFADERKKREKSFNSILSKMDDNEQRLLKQSVEINKLSLRDKLRFLLFTNNGYKVTPETEDFIKKVAKNRNLLVHGGKKKDEFDRNQMFFVNKYLRAALTVSIIKAFGFRNNNTSYMEAYNQIIKDGYEAILTKSY